MRVVLHGYLCKHTTNEYCQKIRQRRETTGGGVGHAAVCLKRGELSVQCLFECVIIYLLTTRPTSSTKTRDKLFFISDVGHLV